jgi:hypothetical protein
MKTSRTSRLRGDRIEVDPGLVDRLVELYCDWRTECAEVQATYERLSRARTSERELAHAAYDAALDREGSAAEMYAAQLELIVSLGTGDTRDPPQRDPPHRTRIRR